MSMIDLETCIAEFLAIGRKLQSEEPLTGRMVLEELTTWYRDTRVDGASLDEDADMLLLQWGASSQLILPEPTDLRVVGEVEISYSALEHRYLDVTRQVFVFDQDDDEFDDNAIQMSITIGFDQSDGNETSSNLWIRSPGEIDTGVQAYLNDPFVQAHVSTPARSVTAVVNHCG